MDLESFIIWESKNKNVKNFRSRQNNATLGSKSPPLGIVEVLKVFKTSKYSTTLGLDLKQDLENKYAKVKYNTESKTQMSVFTLLIHYITLILFRFYLWNSPLFLHLNLFFPAIVLPSPLPPYYFSSIFLPYYSLSKVSRFWR